MDFRKSEKLLPLRSESIKIISSLHSTSFLTTASLCFSGFFSDDGNVWLFWNWDDFFSDEVPKSEPRPRTNEGPSEHVGTWGLLSPNICLLPDALSLSNGANLRGPTMVGYWFFWLWIIISKILAPKINITQRQLSNRLVNTIAFQSIFYIKNHQNVLDYFFDRSTCSKRS